MCAGVEEPGMTAQPLDLAQANSTALTVMPRSCAIFEIALPARSLVEKRAPPSELYAVTTTPWPAQVATAACQAGELHGWYWIWFTYA